jgi:tetratricopeptide (TPR) repeat protein
MIPILLLFLLIPFTYAGAVSIPMGGIAPDFTLSSVEGKKVSLNEYRGKTVVLIYWKTAQDRSLLALEDGMDIFKRYRGKGVHVIGLIAEADKQEKIRRIIKDHKIDFPVLLDLDRRVYGDYGIRVYPSTIIINKDGKLAYDIPGHAPTYKMILEGYLQYMLGEIDKERLKEIISPHKDVKDKLALKAERRYNLALQFAEAGLIKQAMESVKETIELKPDIAKPHILLGFLFLQIKDADMALQEFSKAIEIDPLSHDAKTGLGGALVMKGDIDRAIEVLSEAVVANPHPQRAYYELGIAYELKGEKDRAIEMYKKAIERVFKKRLLPPSLSKCK